MSNKTGDLINLLYEEVKMFNEIAGTLDNVSVESISNQLDFHYEEGIETITAFDEQDDCELVDGVADQFVTLMGLIQKMEQVGYNVAEAIKRVNANNLSKYTMFKEFQPPNTNAVYNVKHGLWVFLDKETNKIKKPLNFKPVDLSGTYPNFLKGGV